MIAIDSPQNATFKKLLSLTTAKGLKKEGLFLLSGENLVREFLQRPQVKAHYELATTKMKPVGGGLPVLQLASALFDALDVVGTRFNILVLEQPPVAQLNAEDVRKTTPQGLELVVPMGDPGNLGAVIRSAEAFGVARVLLAEEAAHPFLPKAVKASAGSVLRMPLARGPALDEFPEDCVALDAGGTVIDEFAWPRDMRLVVGEEGRGLGGAKFKRRISIPTEGVESLNAVVAASVALALRRQRA